MSESYEPPANGWRTFVTVWATQSVSVFGTALTFFAITVWVTQVLYPAAEQKAELAAALSLISLAFAIPTLLSAPLAGAWADRHDRKRTMMAMDFANGCLSLLLGFLVLSGEMRLPLLLGLVVIHSLLGAFHGSAFDTSYAMLVPKDRLPRANAMMQTIWSLSGIISPAIAASILAIPALARQGAISGGAGAALGRLSNGAPLAMFLDAFTFFAASAVLLLLVVPSPRRADLATTDATGRVQRKSIWADVAEGGLYIWRRRPMLWLLGTFTACNFLTAPFGLFLPLLLKFNLAGDWGARGFSFETALGLVTSIGSIGGVAGGLIMSAWGGLRVRRVYGVIVPIFFAGLAELAYGLSPLLFLTAGLNAVFDGLIPVMNSHSQAIWQTQTPHELQGRVFAVRRVIAQFTWPLGTAIAGWAGGAFNPGAVLAVLGVTLSLFSLVQLFNPYLLRVEDKAWLDQMASAAGEA